MAFYLSKFFLVFLKKKKRVMSFEKQIHTQGRGKMVLSFNIKTYQKLYSKVTVVFKRG